MKTQTKEKETKIKGYWGRIDKIEHRIEELSQRGADYSGEMIKRKSLLQNVRRIEKKRRKYDKR